MSGIVKSDNNVEYINVFQPLPWQVKPFYSKASVLVLTGSAGGGKSRLACEKVHAFARYYNGATCLLLRKARQSMTNSTVAFYEHAVVGNDPRVKHYSSKLRFEYDNGSHVYYGGMFNEEQAEQIRSIGKGGGLDMVFMEEATEFTETDFNEVAARMRGRAADWTQIILSCNPDHPRHWIKRRLIDSREAEVYYSGALDNPYNPSSYIEFLGRITGVQGLRLRDGLWVVAEGAVYPCWDSSVHIVQDVKIEDHWRRIRSIDFGYTNPFTCQWWAQDEDGVMYLYRQIYGRRKNILEWGELINVLSAGEKIECTICDWDSGQRAVLEDEFGILTWPANKDINRGVQEVEARLRGINAEVVATDWLAHGDDIGYMPEVLQPTLYVLSDSLVQVDDSLRQDSLPVCLEEEIVDYHWPVTKEGKPVREVPVKVNDHAMDAMRYAVMYFADRLEDKVGSTYNPIFRGGR